MKKTKLTKKEALKLKQDLHSIVLDIAQSANDLMMIKVQKVPDRLRWLVFSRALNYMYDSHYNNTVSQTRAKVQSRKAHEDQK